MLSDRVLQETTQLREYRDELDMPGTQFDRAVTLLEVALGEIARLDSELDTLRTRAILRHSK